MPIYEYSCPAGHVTETLYARSDDAPAKRRCNAVSGADECKKLARRIVSRCGVVFENYAFSADGYMSYSDRQLLATNENVPHVGNANKEAMKKTPNRLTTRYKGKVIKKVK